MCIKKWKQNSYITFGSRVMAGKHFGLAKTGGRNTDSSKALMSKIAEPFKLPVKMKTGCQLHFRFRSYGGKTLPGWPKLVKGAQIAHKIL